MKYAVVTLCNDNYIRYTKNLIKSFYINNKWFDGDFVILHDDKYCILSEESQNELLQFNQAIIFRKCNYNDYKDIMEKYSDVVAKDVYVMCMYKLEIFQMEDYDKILFLDSDMLVLHSLKNIFDLNIPFGACIDGDQMGDEPRFDYTIENAVIANRYFNSGLLYIGNKILITREAFDDIIDFGMKLPLGELDIIYDKIRCIGNFPEQDLLNLYFIGTNCAYLLNSKFNTPYSIDGFKNYKIDINKVSVIHFWTKPDDIIDDVTKIWYIYEKLPTS